VGATIHHALSLHLLYAPLYRPSGTRLGVVALDVGLGSNIAILLTTINPLWKAKKHLDKA
jgi:hypothetical protein